MLVIDTPSVLPIDAYLDGVFPSLVKRIDAKDTMMGAADTPGGYYGVGRSAARCILSALAACGARTPAKILDFGCGWGRVTRWLRASFPAADVYGCDIDAAGINFVADVIGARTFPASTDIDAIPLQNGYDLIFVGSVVTHLDEANSARLMGRLFEALAPGGVLVVTSHGRDVASRVAAGGFIGKATEAPYAQALTGYQERGFGYGDYLHMIGKGYGLSLTNPAWLVGWAERTPGCRMVSLIERGWNNHQDVSAYRTL